jgi:hypothetical protein
MLSVANKLFVLSVVMLSVVMLTVMAPTATRGQSYTTFILFNLVHPCGEELLKDSPL